MIIRYGWLCTSIYLLKRVSGRSVGFSRGSEFDKFRTIREKVLEIMKH